MAGRAGRARPDQVEGWAVIYRLIRVQHLTKTYHNGAGDIEVLRDVNLEINPGEMVAVMGPSGSGKSTLLYILGLLLAPSQGSFFWENNDVFHLDRNQQAEFRRRPLGFVFQACDLLENSNVYENLEFPLIYASVERQARPIRIQVALERVNPLVAAEAEGKIKTVTNPSATWEHIDIQLFIR